YIALIFFTLLWVVGCNPTLRKLAFDAGMFEDDYRYGDLYRLTNLAQFKSRTQLCSKQYGNGTAKNNMGLYLIGDSFTEEGRVNADDFNAQTYLRIHWSDSVQIHLDTTKRNVLVLQTVERHFREHFAGPVHNFSVVPTPVVPAPSQPETWEERLESWEQMIQKSEEALISCWFASDWAFRIKEWKAALNLHFFDRHDDQAAISPDGKNLLFCWDTDSTRITSSFKYLPDSEVETLVKQANQTRDYYRKMGFDEVYLAIIPNKTSIVAPNMGSYNHLVERVQQHPNLQIPVIDIWKRYKPRATEVYQLGDTHWNCLGQQLWLKEVNQVLR
nr:hypothetical protein [Spirosomataceae bacterium]